MKILDMADTVYAVVQRIPRGKVLTYGDVARLAGVCGPRQVGYLLHHNLYQSRVPCHRVVSVGGRLANTFAFGGLQAQRKLLEREGIMFIGKKVDMKRCRWGEL